MAQLSVYLFGRFCLRSEGRGSIGFDAHKLQELLSYLLIHRDHTHPREFLASLLWGDTPTAQSKRNLRQILWQLQNALDSQTDYSDDRLLRVEQDCVHLDSQAGLWLDVAVFEQAFAPVRDVQGQDLDAQRVHLLEGAVKLYQGDLLEGWYQDWCLYERERLQNIYLSMLDKLMGYSEAHHEYETGILYGARVLLFDRAREHTHRQLMRLQYLAGNRTGALRQYERCVIALEQELGVKPARGTTILYDQIRADHIDGAATRPSEIALAPEGTDSFSVTVHPSNVPDPTDSSGSRDAGTARLPEVATRLKQLQDLLVYIQQLVNQDIENVEASPKRLRQTSRTRTE
jgi:DNA-binding SARP family transcriptional activator